MLSLLLASYTSAISFQDTILTSGDDDDLRVKLCHIFHSCIPLGRVSRVE